VSGIPDQATAPRFSIFIPVWNDTRWLPGAIESVLAQTYGDWELVVGDNASTEDIEGVVHGFGDPRIRYHRWERHVDIFENFNRTALLCGHEWVQFLGADDRLRPRCLERMADAVVAVASERSIAMVLTACRRVDQAGRSADRAWYGSKPRVAVAAGVYDAASWLRIITSDGNPPWNVGSVAIARHVVHESGGYFRPEVGLSSDVEMEFRAAAYGDVVYVDEPLLDFTVRPDSDGPGRLLENRARGDARTVIGAALMSGLSVHEHRRDVAPEERALVFAAIARSHLQRAAQHRVLPAGRGRRGALRDVWRALIVSPRTALSPMNVAYGLAAIVAPRRLLEAAKNRLSARHR
jgi:glycosyltransferase involved in cell wall biosynthesis